MNKLLDIQLDFTKKPKILTIDIYFKNELEEIKETYYTYFLYNYSDFFKLMIENTKEDIVFDYTVKKYFDQISHNQLEIEQKDLLEFTQFCDFIQFHKNIYIYILSILKETTLDLDRILAIVYNYIDDSKKLELYLKYKQFKLLSSKDLKMIALRTNITTEFYKELLSRSDIKLTDEEENLIDTNDIRYTLYIPKNGYRIALSSVIYIIKQELDNEMNFIIFGHDIEISSHFYDSDIELPTVVEDDFRTNNNFKFYLPIIEKCIKKQNIKVKLSNEKKYTS